MPPGGARRGRRDNGLIAAAYAAVGDVDPRVGEHLLDVLAAAGIAAYLQPASDLHPVTRTTTLPARPTDRLFADRERLAAARDFLARLRADGADEVPASEPPEPGRPTTGQPAGEQPGTGPPAGASGPGDAGTAGDPPAADPPGSGPPRSDPPEGGPAGSDPPAREPLDVDAVWARIVAGYDEEFDGAGRWPAAEDVDGGGGDTRAPGRRDTGQPDLGNPRGQLDDRGPGARPYRVSDRLHRRGEEPPSLLDALDTFGAHLPDEDDEGYTPPPAPPLPRPSRNAVVALLAVLAGLAIFFFPALLPIDNDVTLLLGFAALLTGVVMLIWRLRPGDEEDDDPDDGAVV